MQRSAATASVDEQKDPFPLRTLSARPKLVRVRPPQVDKLREARIEFVRRYGAETDEQLIHDQFYDEAFDAWLASKLNPNGKAEKAKRGGGA